MLGALFSLVFSLEKGKRAGGGGKGGCLEMREVRLETTF